MPSRAGAGDLPLLKSKLYIPPPRTTLVPRPRLIERLNESLHPGHKLTLVSAPAGYGKTTLLGDWIRSKEYEVGSKEGADAASPTPYSLLPTPCFSWLSLDAEDSDPARFLAYMVAAVQTVEPHLGQEVLAALQSPQPPGIGDLLAMWANQLDAVPDPFVLVLDDYHLIASLEVHQAVAFLLDHLPMQMHVILSTRSDPLLPLARLRGRGQLVELRQEELCFTLDEARCFLEQMLGLALAAEDVAALAGRTEGWAAGLQMASLAMQGLTLSGAPHEGDRARLTTFIRAFSGSHRYILDYLAEEVLGHQPAEIQRFLLQTSILDRLTGPLCDAVTRQQNSQATLEQLARANLFLVPLDDEQQWYRYHHLFAELLRRRLSQAVEADEFVALHRRASMWLEREGWVAEAVAHVLAASDYDYAADLVERHILDRYYGGETVLVHSWLKALPEHLVHGRPLLCAVYASTSALIAGLSPDSLEAAERWLREAEAALAVEGNALAGKAPREMVAGFTAKFRAYLARFRGDDPQTVIDLTQRALALLPEGSLTFRSALAFNLGEAYSALGDGERALRLLDEARRIGEASGDLFNALIAASFQASALAIYGRLREAEALCRETLRSVVEPAERAGQVLPPAGGIYISLGNILLERNELAEAERAFARGLELIALTAVLGSVLQGHVGLVRIRQAQGDPAGALEVWGRLEQRRLSAISMAVAWRVRIYLGQGDPAAAERLLEQQPGTDSEAFVLAREIKQITQARILLAQGQAAEAAKRLAELAQAAESAGRNGRLIEIRVLEALALRENRESDRALAALKRALDLAEPEGYMRLFLDEGPAVAALLELGTQQKAWRELRLGRYVSGLLDAFGASPVPPAATDLPEPLTERELEVLRLMAAGYSNQEIADELVLAMGTVKAHVHNIHGKLDVRRRSQAIARARELGLL